MSKNGYPLSIKFVRTLALVIVRQRALIFQTAATDGGSNYPERTGNKPSTNATQSLKQCE
jgi:hypothetical protein